MNYSRKISRRAIARRFVLSCTITGVLCMLIGIFIGYLLWGFIPASAAVKPEPGTDIQYAFYIPNLDDSEVTVITTEPVMEETEADVQEAFYISCRMPYEQQEYLYNLCKKYDLDYCLVMALIELESSFNPKAVSSTNDYGLMQINKCNHSSLKKTLGISDFMDPYQNMEAGCYMLSEIQKSVGKEPALILMSYNMGTETAKKKWNNGTRSTSYTRHILSTYEQYKAELGW